MEKSILNEFLSKVVERTKNIKVGDPMNPDTQMGALISEEHLHKVLEYVDTAKKEVKKTNLYTAVSRKVVLPKCKRVRGNVKRYYG